MTLLSLGSRFFLALLLLAASVPKLISPEEFRQAVRNYRLLPERLAKPVATWLPRLELTVALMLLAGVAVSVAAMLAAALFVAMAVAVAANLARGRTIECGCFGAITRRRISWGLVAQNLSLALAAGYLGLHPAGFELLAVGADASGASASASEVVAAAIGASASLAVVGLASELRRAQRVIGTFTNGGPA